MSTANWNARPRRPWRPISTTIRILQRRVADLRAINASLREWSESLIPPRETARPAGATFENRNIRRRHAAFGFKPLWSHALAAGLALVFGLGIGQFVNLSARQNGPGVEEAAHRLLQAALERTVSGQAISWSDDAYPPDRHCRAAAHLSCDQDLLS